MDGRVDGQMDGLMEGWIEKYGIDRRGTMVDLQDTEHYRIRCKDECNPACILRPKRKEPESWVTLAWGRKKWP